MSTTLRFSLVLTLSGLLSVGSASAAYIVATDGSLGTGDFAYTGAGGGGASTSTASSGQLPATTDPTPTFFTLDHVYGGTGTSDEYTFSYTPGSDPDNVVFAASTNFNLPQGLSSTGLSGGSAGVYNIYRIHPSAPGVSGGLTLYEVFVNGGLQTNESIDQNLVNSGTGEGVGRWELIGSVNVLNATDTVTVTMTPTNSTFVSMRASGIMFEYVAPIPEPGAVVLVGLGWALLGLRRRR